MTIVLLIGQFLLFWAIIYVVTLSLQHFFMVLFISMAIERKRRPSFQAQELLPTSGQIDPDDEESWGRVSNEPLSTYDIKLFHVRYQTNGYNQFFQRWAQKAPKFWDVWFSIGVAFGAITMIVGIITITYAGIQIALSVKSYISSSDTISESGNLHKRSDIVNEQRRQDDQVFLPMIPGVTLPLEHLGYYLVALLISGVIHEAGHAIASFHEHIPINHSGIFLYIVYPGAFVDIPSRPLSLLSPIRQLKVICAGVWHNFVLWVITAFVLSSGLKLCLQLTGWRSLESGGGVSVVDVSSESPMAPHLPISSVIYRLNDYYLENNIFDWNKILIQDGVWSTSTSGFCVEEDELQVAESKANLDCCKITPQEPFGTSPDSALGCFQDFLGDQGKPSADPQYLICLHTANTLTHPKRVQCSRSIDCLGSKSRCMTPYTPESAAQALRIYRRPPSWESAEKYPEDKPIVFVGELVDVWESVKVGILQPRFSFLPVSLPQMLELTISYMSSFTLALSLLNILPAFQLDGEYALSNLVTLLILGNKNAEQGISTSQDMLRQSAKRFEVLLVRVTSGLVGVVVIGSILLGILNAAA
ncbi:hypothetical protein NQZ79_g6852 [Umbelopsis isabellina]|nr:hypothetical protein NQZ79_g6852 [Umbelopsis isabellina]